MVVVVVLWVVDVVQLVVEVGDDFVGSVVGGAGRGVVGVLGSVHGV